jgi:citrate lyase subunit beta / citryl-CoA lyase
MRRDGLPRMRSVLFTPGDRGDRLRKAWSAGAADVAVADLEDAVALTAKAAARAEVAAALRDTPSRSLRAVRINPWPGALAEADLEAVVPARPEAILLPKSEAPEAVAAADTRIGELERRHGLPAGHVRMVVVAETAAGVLRARELALASPRCIAVAFGAEDLAADAGIRRTPTNAEVATARSLVVLGAAAAGVAAIDMITADPRDLERTALEAAEARGLGFSGKMCIHPAQVVAVHEAFRPTPGELAWARQVVAAVEAAGVEEGGVVVVEGRMVDVPFIRQARRILAGAGA